MENIICYSWTTQKLLIWLTKVKDVNFKQKADAYTILVHTIKSLYTSCNFRIKVDSRISEKRLY